MNASSLVIESSSADSSFCTKHTMVDRALLHGANRATFYCEYVDVSGESEVRMDESTLGFGLCNLSHSALQIAGATVYGSVVNMSNSTINDRDSTVCSFQRGGGGGAPRTRKRHQREHRPQRPTESSDTTPHAKGRTGDCPGPRKETTTRRNVTRGVRSLLFAALRQSSGAAFWAGGEPPTVNRWQ